MALKDLVSDLSNFNGRSQYDGLDSQIENGVDYFPNDDAPGFTPKTDLESLYKKANSVVPPNVSGFVPASDGQLSQTWGSTFPTQFKDGFLPIANAVSKYNPPKNTLTHLIEPNISSGPEESIFEPTFNLIPGKGTKQVLAIAHGSNFTSMFGSFLSFLENNKLDRLRKLESSKTLTIAPNLTTGPTQPLWIPGLDDTPQIPNAHGSEFMVTPIKDFTSKYDGESIGAGSNTLTVKKEAFRRSSEDGASNVDTFRSIFSVDTTKSIYNDSSYIKDLFEFRKDGRDTFKNVPSGMNENGNFGTTDFRTIANKGPFKGNTTHPIILRKPGSNWDNVLNESVIGGAVGDVVAGALGVVGLLTRTSRDLADKARIFRFLISGKGIAFVAKQVAFQALNPTIESKIFNPLSTLGIAGAGDLLQGNEGGLLRAASSFLFPTHVERHLPNVFLVGNPSRYSDFFKPESGFSYEDGENKYSRLAFQAKAFGIGTSEVDIPEATGFGARYINRAVNRISNAAAAAVYSPTFVASNPNKYLFPISSAPKSVKNGRPSFVGTALDLGISDVGEAISKRGGTFNRQSSELQEGGPSAKKKTHKFKEYAQLLKKARDSERKTGSPIVKKIGEQGINLGAGRGAVRLTSRDEINMHPFKTGNIRDEKDNYKPLESKLTSTVKDFIKFNFHDLTNDKFLIFRAILEGITDTVTPNYSEENYIGRPDKVFVYQNVDRTISFTFSIYPKSKEEMKPLIIKLNHLVGLCYPTFSQTERMQAPFMALTMGDMFKDTPGILTGLTVTVEEASTWEIEDGLQFPHFIKAACEFKHIGSHIPDARGKHYDLSSIKDVERGLTIPPQQ